MEAFQLSGIETLTVPETVTTIEYGAMRDMKMLESVTIKGNVDIPVYAFRACTNLKTVVLEGDDVTFGAGSKGMIFTNKENGDGSAITVYVQNETVKA
ncbi:MAG: leucine-rich repeat protein, partial [Clostridia bacterium]|nr:leucine-rich repeat protein [Clostridia bacterium]